MLLVQCLFCVGLGAAIFLSTESEAIADMDTTKIKDLATYMNSFVPFVLGLYVSLAISRWWALRVNALGAIFDAIPNTVALVACCLPSQEYGPIRASVVRWGLASI